MMAVTALVDLGYDVVPAGAAGLRFSGSSSGGWTGGQAGCGIAAILAKAATIAVTHGQDSGILSRRRREL